MPEPRLLQRISAAFWVFLGAFLIQFAILQSIADSRHFLPDGDDMKFYDDWARRIAGGQFTDGKAFYGLPGYAYALAAIYTVTGGYDHWLSPFLVAQLQAVFHALTAMFLFLIGRRAFGKNACGTAIGAIAAAAWVAFTPAQVFSAILMPTSWVVCVFWGTVLWLIRTHQLGASSMWRPWLPMGLLMGIVATTVANILILLPLVLVCIALTMRSAERRIIAFVAVIVAALASSTAFSAAFDFSWTKLAVASAFVAGALMIGVLRPPSRGCVVAAALTLGGIYAGMSPVWLHNRLVANDTVLLSAHDGLNFYLGNHATANGYTKIPAGLRASQDGLLRDSLSIPEREAGRPLKRSEVSAYWKAKGQAFVREHPGAWLRLLGVKLANFWNAFQYDDLSILKLLRDEGAVPPGLRFGFIAALALPGLLVCWRRWPVSRWIAAASLLHMTGLMTVFITERYRLAAVPGLIFVAAGGLVWLWENLTQRAWIRASGFIVMLAGTTWFCSMPQKDIGLWSLDFYKAGIRATDGAIEARARAARARAAGEDATRWDQQVPPYLDHAQRSLEIAFAYVPDNPEIVFALGNVWMQRDNLDHADRCYGRALRLSVERDPARPHDGALNNLGVIATRRGRWADAEKFLLGSLKFEPEDAETWLLLAQTRRELRNIPGAVEAVERALLLRPGNAAMLKFRRELDQPPPP